MKNISADCIMPVMVIGAAAVLMPGWSRAQNENYSHYVSPWKTPWDNEGPRGAEHWSSLDPAYVLCNTGKQQSPIDIRGTKKAKLPPLRFEYVNEPFQYVINNGHTIRVDYHNPAGAGSFLLVGQKRYQLTQFHFHRPSEERVNGKQYDMVLHLMHKASDGEVAGVVVFIKQGHANSTVQQVWSYMPEKEGQRAAPGASLDPTGMVPQYTGYYLYDGSQTAPPCNEGVKWFVLKTPMELSAAQIKAFAALYPNDARPPQPLNGRIVEESE
jgi:carbonic anhydrase